MVLVEAKVIFMKAIMVTLCIYYVLLFVCCIIFQFVLKSFTLLCLLGTEGSNFFITFLGMSTYLKQND